MKHFHVQGQKVALAVFCLITLILGSVYWPGLHGAFFFDDGPSILLEPGVRIDSISWESLRQVWLSGSAGPSGRPIAQLSFAANYYFAGFSPFAYKATNLAIHGLCGLVVFQVSRKIFEKTQQTASKHAIDLASATVASIWLLHPIQTLVVLHVVQRMTSLSALFLLTALLFHIRARTMQGREGVRLLAFAWLILWPFSYLSKETGALFPLFALAWELFIRRSSVGFFDRSAKWLIFIAGLGAATLVLYGLSERANWLWSAYEMRPFSMAQRALTEARVIWSYLGLLLFPRPSAFGLFHDDIAISNNWLTPWTTAPAVIGLLMLLLLVWKFRQRVPVAGFGLAWFLIGHLLESTILPLEIAHEHRNYVPSFGIVIGSVGLLLHVSQVKQAREKIWMSLATATLSASAAVTAMIAFQFSDEVRRTQVAVEYHPQSARTQDDAGWVLLNLASSDNSVAKLYPVVRNHFELSTQLDANSKSGLVGLIRLNCLAGLAPAQSEVAELTRRLHNTPFAPGDRNALYGVKSMAIAETLCLSRIEVDALFLAAIANPTVSGGVRAILLSWYADYLWLGEQDMAAAKAAIVQSLTLNPTSSSNKLKWAQLQYISGNPRSAIAILDDLRDATLTQNERETINDMRGASTIDSSHQ